MIESIDFNSINMVGSKMPEVGDVLVIETRKSGNKKFLAPVKAVVNDNEVILQLSTNSFYNHDMYYAGESWIKRIWNLGEIELTTNLNNNNQFADK